MGNETEPNPTNSNQYPELSRRKFLRIAASAVAASTLLEGCLTVRISAPTPSPTPSPSPTLEPIPTLEPTPEPTPNPILDSQYYVPPAERIEDVGYAGMVITNTGSPDSVSIAYHDLYYEEMVFATYENARKLGINLNWFVVGEALRLHSSIADILKQAVEIDGDELGNHTENHFALDGLPLNRVESQARKQERTVAELLGVHESPLLAPPGGNGAYGPKPDKEMLQEAIEDGWILTMWSKTSNGYLNRHDQSEAARLQVLEDIGEIEPGDIIVLHDAWPDANALPELVQRIWDQGLKVEPITRAMQIDPNLFNRRVRIAPPPKGFEPSPNGSGLYVPRSPRPSLSGTIFQG